MSGAYGTICGVLYVDNANRTSRCYARGHARYGGRCLEHEGVGEEYTRPRQGPRCGWTRTENGLACANPVFRPGQRCSLHAPDRIQSSQARRVCDLQAKLAYKLEQQRNIERDIGWLRAELGHLGARVDQEAAE